VQNSCCHLDYLREAHLESSPRLLHLASHLLHFPGSRSPCHSNPTRWRPIMASFARRQMPSNFSKLAEEGCSRVYNEDSPKKNVRLSLPDPSTFGTRERRACEDGRTESRGAPAVYLEASSHTERWKEREALVTMAALGGPTEEPQMTAGMYRTTRTSKNRMGIGTSLTGSSSNRSASQLPLASISI